MGTKFNVVKRTLPVLLSLVALPVLPARASGPDLSNYPLRLQVLAVTAQTRLPTNPFTGGGGGAAEGVDAPMMMGSGPQLDRYSIPVFYGQGWGDLLSSDASLVPQALNFNYDDCANRVAASMPHEPLAARWKKMGDNAGNGITLEVLVPLEVLPAPGHPEQLDVKKYDRCEISATLYDFVYLKVKNGSIVRVSRSAFLKKPALRQFVDNVEPTLQPREAKANTP